MDNNSVHQEKEENNKWKPGSVTKSTWYDLPALMLLFLLQSLFLPYFWLKCLVCCNKQGDHSSSCRKRLLQSLLLTPARYPIVTFCSDMIGYLIFLAFVIMRIAYYIAEPNLTWIDWVILLYVTAMIVEEIYQMSNEQTSYFNITNVVDISIILLFSCFFVLRIVGSPAKNLLMMRISEHVFAVAAGVSFLRVLHYSQVSRKLGPIQISFIEITTEVVSFVAILGVILVAFALALSGSYTAGIHTADFEKGNISVPHNFNG